jgi:DNA-directed RNA polymerase specialized sigma24 family protein
VADTAEVMRKNEGAVRIMQHRAVKRLAKLFKSLQEGQTNEL